MCFRTNRAAVRDPPDSSTPSPGTPKQGSPGPFVPVTGGREVTSSGSLSIDPSPYRNFPKHRSTGLRGGSPL